MAETAAPGSLERPRPLTQANGARAGVVIIGAGPGGLAAARELARRRIRYRLLERGDAPGYTWRNLYDSLTLHTGKHLSSLPGMRFPRTTPLFPRRDDFVDYLDRYRQRFAIGVETGVTVTRATRANGGWQLETSAGPIEARALVVASGIVAQPLVPAFEGQETFGGRIMHSVEYRRPGPFAGRRVLIVGCGNSGGEIASELADNGVSITIAVRSGANVVPLTLAGVPIQYVAFALRRWPLAARQRVVALVRRISEAKRGPAVLPQPPWGPLDRIPLIGFHLVDAIRDGRVQLAPGIERFVPGGVRFTDGSEQPFDDVILATGYRPALQFLDGAVRVDPAGFALRNERVISADQPDLYFVGHNYDSTGGLHNIAQDAPVVARRIAAAG